MALQDLHLADLHERARAAGVPRFRMLTREELIEALETATPPVEADLPVEPDVPEAEAASEVPAAEELDRPRRGRRGRRGRGRRSEADESGGAGDAERAGAETERDERERDEREGDEPEQPAEADVATEEVSGVLDRLPQGYGFLRLHGLEPAEGDVYVSASQIRRCELRPGDEVSGPARAPRRGEHHRALVRVGSVNGQEPEGERTTFEDLTPVAPHRRLALGESGEPIARAVDAIAPLALGQRVLILAEPRSGRTTLLRAIAASLSGGDVRLRVLLADERPEEVTEWRRSLPEAEIVPAPADQEPADQVRAAELAIGNAKRRAEAGEDVVVIIDSLSRLALGYRDPNRVKRLFGAGRELAEEGSGSLTLIATVLDSDERGAEVRELVETTENVLLRLDASLASRGITPSLVITESSATNEDRLRSPEELEAARRLRAELDELDPADAARTLGERIAATGSNAELLG
jgi:transcription termination factor Rho